ncbi:ABC transporter permease [Mycetocola miduiensis]|uniref:Iron(III) transport system permease protein n=1 Tax=Mycetocola miduiensis TaxID=995034 RepID=A0A1I5CUV3_9MICO|nr:iron ABC transporter permease [Mycetocola miduiensis]SFN90744.1 iron(III) transport system permease protein [Mycetocola miduiensis]
MPQRRAAPPVLVTVVVVLALGALIPIGYVVQAAVAMGWDELAALVFRPKVGELLANTVLLVIIGVPATVVLGVGGAWLVERTALPGRKVFAVAFAAPLAIPAFVSSYGWASAVPSISGLWGGLLVAVTVYFPLVYLPALAAIRGLDPALEESARSLGMGSWSVFSRVVLPQLRLAVLGGGLVVALHLLAEYGAFAFLRFDTFTTAIVVAYQASFAGPNAAALGLVLVLLCLCLLVAESLARGQARYSRVGGGSPHPPARLPLGPLTPVAIIAATCVVATSTLVPLTSVVRWLFHGGSADLVGLTSATGQTLLLAIAAAVCAIAVALPFAWLAVRYPGRLSRLLEGAAYLASSLPSIIVALALVVTTIAFAPALYQTAFTVIAAYVVIFLPRALVPLRAGLSQVPESLEEAARSLGVAPFRARLRVTVPLLIPSICAGGALVALGAANELTATLLLAPTGTRTVATSFWAAASSLDYPTAAPYAIVLVLLSCPAVALMFAHATGRNLR